MTDFFKGIDNHVKIKHILKEYEVQYEAEEDLEFFDELQDGIMEDYPNISNLEVVLKRIVIYLSNRDLCL
tara:strand:+ start:1775 stop:1984 length:210 start_codon:yes stop_codon:yes gene_type:complete